jgi:antitoxin ParD1/3/4
MKKNITTSLGPYFESFIAERIHQGRYGNAEEVIRAGLRLLEEEETQILSLKKAIQEGIDSGNAVDFEPQKHLNILKSRKQANG